MSDFLRTWLANTIDGLRTFFLLGLFVAAVAAGVFATILIKPIWLGIIVGALAALALVGLMITLGERL